MSKLSPEQIYARDGYIVLGFISKPEIGELVYVRSAHESVERTPWIISGESTRQEYFKNNPGAAIHSRAEFFYRAVAAD